MRSLNFLSCASVLALTVPGVAYAQDILVAQAMELQAKGRADEAYRLLEPQADARAGNPDFDYVLGMAAADSGRSHWRSRRCTSGSIT